VVDRPAAEGSGIELLEEAVEDCVEYSGTLGIGDEVEADIVSQKRAFDAEKVWTYAVTAMLFRL